MPQGVQHLRLIFAARLPQTRVCKLLFWRTVITHNLKLAHIVAHCSCTQCAPQVCSAQLPHTVLAHNVRRKYDAQVVRTILAHNVRRTAKFATVVILAHNERRTGKNLQRTVVHTILLFAAHSCRALHCSSPPTPPPPHPTPFNPHRHFF